MSKNYSTFGHEAGSNNKVYQNWPGNNWFLCRGRIMFGSGPHCLLSTLLAIVTTFVMFQVYVAPHFPWWHQCIAGAGFALSLLFCLLTALSDPGIVPRRPSTVAPPSPRILDTDMMPLRYCDTCNLYRPPRAKHCRYCDNCVREFDHHCPWVGNCIGQRNYRYFLLFVGTLLLLSVHLLCLSLLLIFRTAHQLHSRSEDEWFSCVAASFHVQPVAYILSALLVLAIVSLMGLAVYHLKLISLGLTTNEELRGTYQGIHNPFHRGLCRNCRRVCCRLPAASALRLQDDVDRVWAEQRVAEQRERMAGSSAMGSNQLSGRSASSHNTPSSSASSSASSLNRYGDSSTTDSRTLATFAAYYQAEDTTAADYAQQQVHALSGHGAAPGVRSNQLEDVALLSHRRQSKEHKNPSLGSHQGSGLHNVLEDVDDDSENCGLP